jgi:hypothetical protein
LRNRSTYAAITVTGTVVQVPQTDDPPLAGNSYPLPGGSIPVSFNDSTPISILPAISWNWTEWPWFSSATFIRFGPDSRYFHYHINFAGHDEFGNPIGSITARDLDILVYITDEKLAEHALALAGQIVALALLVIAAALLASGYGAAIAVLPAGAAAIAEGLARNCETLALDPPQPDSRYMELVPFYQKDQKQDPKAGGGTQLPSLMEFLLFAQRVVAIPTAMSAIEGKLMGARQAKDQSGIDLQTGSYVKAQQAMISDTQSLMKLLPAIQKELNALNLDPKVVQQSVGKIQQGFSQDLRDSLSKGGVSDENQKFMMEAATNPDIAKEMADAYACIERMAQAIAQATLHVRNSAASALQTPFRKAKSKSDKGKGQRS